MRKAGVPGSNPGAAIYNNMIEEKVLDCGESGTTARLAMLQAGMGIVGEGIFVFTGQGKLPIREHRTAVDYINQQATRDLLNKGTCLSMAIPANRKYNMPIKIYVGTEALKQLIKEINSKNYEYFRHALLNLI